MNTRTNPEVHQSHEGRDTLLAGLAITAITASVLVPSIVGVEYVNNNLHPGQNIGKDLGIGNKSAEVNSQLENGLVHIDLQIPPIDIQHSKTDK